VDLSTLLNRLRGEAASMDSKLVSSNDCIKEHLASIAELEARVTLLKDQRIKIRQLHDHVESFRIPSSIPSEILGEIFIACLPQYPRPIITEAPLLFCRICTTWRQIALNTPQLWEFITLSQTKDVVKLPQVAEKWFLLAGVLPLSLRFDIRGQSELLSHQSLSRSSSNEVWGRLSNLELNITNSHSIRTILRSTQPVLHFSKIERVEVRTNYPLYADVMSPETFPNLRKLIVSYNHPGFHQLDIMPFYRLTHLCLSGLWLSAQSWSSIIRRCVALQHGLFEMVTAMDTTHVAREETTLKHLLTLKIVLHTFGYPRMMDNLHFPSLRSLSIGCVERPGVWNSKCLSPIKSSQLRSLVLYRLKIPIKDLLDILRTTALLDSLVIDLPIRTSKFFEEITIRQQHPSDIVMPMLSRLTIFHAPFLGKARTVHTFDAVCFVDMVKSRWNVGNTAPINRRRLSMVSVHTKASDTQVERTQRMLRRLIQEGLVLKIGVSAHGLRVSTDVSW